MRRMSLLLRPLAIVWLASWALAVQAQDAPQQDLGDKLLREQQERMRDERLQQQTPELAPATAAVDPNATPESIEDAEPTFSIDRIEIQGLDNAPEVLSTNEAARITEPFTGKRLGVNRINLLLRKLTQAFIDGGWVTTRAYIGNQNLASGTLVVTVIPGKIEKLTYNGYALEPKGWNAPGARLAFPEGQGDLLNLADVEQGIDQLNRLKRNHAELKILPGSTPGASVVEVTNREGDRLYYNFGVDNSGSETTGQTRYRTGIEGNNLLGLQESLSLTYVGSLDTNALLANAALPWGYNSVSYTYSYSEFHNLIADTALLFGRSEGHTLAWNRVLSRSRTGKSSVDLSLSLREATREINNVELSPQHLSVLRIGYNRLRRFQLRQAPGYWSVDFGAAQGLNAFGATEDAGDLPEEGAHAQFTKLDLSGSLSMQFGSWTYRGSLNSQWAEKALFGSEQIFGGGIATVRGFAESAIAGDRGYVVGNELAYGKLPALFGDRLRVDPFAFIDSARTQLIAERQWQSIIGAGLGLRVSSKGTATELIFGKPLHHPDQLADHGLRIHANFNLSF